MRRFLSLFAVAVMAVGLFVAPQAALAQSTTPTSMPASTVVPTSAPQGLSLFTSYPMQVIGIGEVTSLDLTLRSGLEDVVSLQMKSQPDGWTSTFRGNGKVIEGAYVEPGKDSTVQLQIEPPSNVAPGKYDFVAQATGKSGTASMAITLTVKNKQPPKITMTTDLPTLKGSPTSTFSYNVTITNVGEENLNVTLSADAPRTFQVNFSLSGQNVSTFPLEANATKTVSVSLQPLSDVTGGDYPVKLTAQGGAASATLTLTASVTGQSSLTLTTSDGRLSDQVTLGQTTPIKVIVQNNGTASARQITMSSSAPAGWKVDFSPKTIAEIPAGQQVEVTANLTPTDQAIAGDYQVTLTAAETGGSSKSADFRITVVTSTLWGVVGVLLIAIAVGVVAAAVMRFGRR